MRLPEINETITTELAIDLCQHFGYDYLVKRLKAHPERYKSWVFDGASMVPDEIFSYIFKLPGLVLLALKHDLKYAYGEPGNTREKLRADLEFELDVLNDGASVELTKMMFTFVDVGGKEWLKTDFSWAYAQVEQSAC